MEAVEQMLRSRITTNVKVEAKKVDKVSVKFKMPRELVSATKVVMT